MGGPAMVAGAEAAVGRMQAGGGVAGRAIESI
jgi:hypothetical protein